MAVSAAVMAGALALALTGRETPSAAASAPLAQSEADESGFVVRFQGRGPIARAVREGDAEAVATQLERQNDFAGLCLQRLSEAGAILRACNAVAASERESFEQVWLQRLRSMRGVAYAEITASPTRAAN